VTDRDWRAAFDREFGNVAETAQRRVWRAVFGDEYPEGIDPYSFVSRTELRQLGAELRVGAGDLFGDLGCGRGGPGLWLVAHTGADLVGVDISPVAIDAATARAATLGLSGARYQVGSFASTGLDRAGLDAIVSIDALIFAPDKRAALVEFARVLRPGGRFVATTWDFHRQPAGRPAQVDDHRPLRAEAGLAELSYTVTDDWRHRITPGADGLHAAAADIAAESGEDVSDVRAQLVQMRDSIDAMTRRVLIVAERVA
jgi:SAM-dependent methyltransferase